MNALEKTLTAFQFPTPQALIDNCRGLKIALERRIVRMNECSPEAATARFNRQMAETKPDGERYQTKAEIVEELRVERQALKNANRRDVRQMFLLVRPVARDFLVFAAEDLEERERHEQELCEEFGVPYSPSGYITGCRAALAQLNRTLEKMEKLTTDDAFPIYLQPGNLMPFVAEFHTPDPVPVPDAHALRMATKPTPKPEDDRPAHLLSEKEQAERARQIDIAKGKIKAEPAKK